MVLTLEPARYSHGGSFPFSFTYRGLYREKPEPGGYTRVAAHYPDGSIKYSYAVNPLVLPPYRGEPSGALPVYATGYARTPPRALPGSRATGEGKTRVNKVPAYQVLYKVRIDGREMYGRNVLLLPERAGRAPRRRDRDADRGRRELGSQRTERSRLRRRAAAAR